MEFKSFKEEYYDDLINFLIEINKNDNHINWNWARFEWMYEHPDFDKNNLDKIGLWYKDGKIIAASIYDMYFGEAFCASLDIKLLPEVINYTYNNLKDNEQIKIAIWDNNIDYIKIFSDLGFNKDNQKEIILKKNLDKIDNISLDYEIKELDYDLDYDKIDWAIYQGFDHGNNKEDYLKQKAPKPKIRKHYNKYLSLGALNENKDIISLCQIWYIEGLDYAYVEPVCTIPEYRNKRITTLLLNEAFRRVKLLGAKYAIVISDLDFYKKIGFKEYKTYSFHYKK